MHTNTPGSLQLANGNYYHPINFDAAHMPIEMIAHSLALKCRWNGNTNDLSPECEPVFYSVAQHACHVHDIARDSKELVLAADWSKEVCPSGYALHHDDSEGPLFDMPRPVKKLPEFLPLVQLENRIQTAVQKAFGIEPSGVVLECVHRIDNAILFWERDALMGKPVEPYSNEADHPGGTIYDFIPDFEPWSPAKAKREFLARHYALIERGVINAL